MAITIKDYDAYYINGKIIEINYTRLTISVTSPFTDIIEFECRAHHYDILHPPVFKYGWIDSQDTHPNVTEASAYYNTNDKCFYRKEEGRKSEWKSTDFEDIRNDNPYFLHRGSSWTEKKYLFFVDKYLLILQKGQFCHFYAYAIHKINRNWHSIQNKQVERHPGDYTWIYDPDSFSGGKWDAESIDGLVKEVRPSRDCLKRLLYAEEWDTEFIDGLVKKIRPSRDCLKRLRESYEVDDRKTKREKWDRRLETLKSIPARVEDFLGRYRRLLWLIITLGMFLVGVVSLIVNYLGILQTQSQTLL